MSCKQVGLSVGAVVVSVVVVIVEDLVVGEFVVLVGKVVIGEGVVVIGDTVDCCSGHTCESLMSLIVSFKRVIRVQDFPFLSPFLHI